MHVCRWANIFLFFSVLFTLFLASNVIVLKVLEITIFLILVLTNTTTTKSTATIAITTRSVPVFKRKKNFSISGVF